MSKWLWIGGAVMLAVAAASTWFAFRNPDFVAGLIVAGLAMLWPVIVKRKSPADEASWRQAEREGRNGDQQGREK